MKMLDAVISQTDLYLENMPKEKRKSYGQFFTSKETARFMAGLFSFPAGKTSISVLDPGAGSGILSCALLERLDSLRLYRTIELTCYETDRNILDLLRGNLEYCRENMKTNLVYRIISENYITSQYDEFNHTLSADPSPEKYDCIIGNPPYMKLPKEAPEAEAMPGVCYGAPNLYFLFAAMSLFDLDSSGEMVYIIPRSWTSGAYFKRFRQYFLSEGKLSHVHLFVSRNKVFDRESVLQETIIIKVLKSRTPPDSILITSSDSNRDFHALSSFSVPYDLAVSGDDFYVYLITDQAELTVLQKMNHFRYTLPDIGVRMKTGLTVDFRNQESLRDAEDSDTVPLFYAHHIKDGGVNFPLCRKNEFLVPTQKGLIQKNQNYLFVKRFTSKEERRRLQCGIYLARDFPQYTMISTQNKINFIDGTVSEMSECLVFGLYVLFNSALYDSYYRILNGSTQVNSTEINAMPVPDLISVQNMGKALMQSGDRSETKCNMILEGYCG